MAPDMNQTGILWLDDKVADVERRQQQISVSEQPHKEENGQVIPFQAAETVYGFLGEVNMSKALSKAAHGLNLSQKRLIMYTVSKIHPTHPQPSQLVVKVNAREYAKEMNVHTKNAYTELREAADKLFDRYISIAQNDKVQKIHWVSSATYHHGDGWVELSFTPEVSPFLSMLTDGNHITYKLQTAIDLRSVYSWRLLELLMQWQDTKHLYIKLDDFRHAMEIPESYLYGDIRAHCIEKSVTELRKKVKIDITWKAVKDKENKRRVGSLEFHWKDIEQHELPLK